MNPASNNVFAFARLSGSPNFCKPGRYIIREGTCMKKGRQIGSPDREYRFFLFSDLLAYATSMGMCVPLVALQ